MAYLVQISIEVYTIGVVDLSGNMLTVEHNVTMACEYVSWVLHLISDIINILLPFKFFKWI
jgi:hypothetical protein